MVFNSWFYSLHFFLLFAQAGTCSTPRLISMAGTSCTYTSSPFIRYSIYNNDAPLFSRHFHNNMNSIWLLSAGRKIRLFENWTQIQIPCNSLYYACYYHACVPFKAKKGFANPIQQYGSDITYSSPYRIYIVRHLRWSPSHDYSPQQDKKFSINRDW